MRNQFLYMDRSDTCWSLIKCNIYSNTTVGTQKKTTIAKESKCLNIAINVGGMPSTKKYKAELYWYHFSPIMLMPHLADYWNSWCRLWSHNLKKFAKLLVFVMQVRVLLLVLTSIVIIGGWLSNTTLWDITRWMAVCQHIVLLNYSQSGDWRAAKTRSHCF